MKKKILLLFLTALLVCAAPHSLFAARALAQDTPSNCSVVLMETGSKRMLYGSGSYDRRRMASTTKVMTAIAVIENCDIDETVTVPAAGTGIEGSSIYLRAGEKLTVRELLYGLMLRSGNDCAVTLALHVSKSVEGFAALMNSISERLGLKDTNFVNPHGLDADGHYTTAYDLAVISCYAMQNEVFREIVGTSRKTISNDGYDYDRLLINKNKILSMLSGGNGIKTGYTQKSGRCLVSSCKRGDMEVVCVVLNCGPMFELSVEFIERMFEKYSLREIIGDYQLVCETDCGLGGKPRKVYAKNGFSYPLADDELTRVSIRVEVDESSFWEKPGSCVGKIKVYYDKELIFSEKLYTIMDVREKDYLTALKRVGENFPFLRLLTPGVECE